MKMAIILYFSVMSGVYNHNTVGENGNFQAVCATIPHKHRVIRPWLLITINRKLLIVDWL